MNKFLLSILTCLLFTAYTNAQKVSNSKTEIVFLDKSDSTKNCYAIIFPDKLPYKGYVVLLPGFGESAKEVLIQTDLPKQLAMNGILTVIATLQDGRFSFGVDSISQKTLSGIIKDVSTKQKLEGQKFYIGGFSIGGSTAIKYAENAVQKPVAVFAIDPPLDFERFYNSAKREIRITNNNDAVEESKYMINRLEKITGGNPLSNLTDYHKLSPYSINDTTQTAIKKLKNIPLRVYTEPDIHWWMNTYSIDYTNMNATECSAMINELNLLGNKNATLITTQNKGFRKPDNNPNPHSWSIVDNEDLIKWILQQK